MSLTLIRSVAGAALLALATGCGTAAAAHSSAPKPPAAHPSQSAPVHAAVTTPPAPPATAAPAPPATAAPAPATAAPAPATAPASHANPIPQGNGGDQDADNNGGPSDGDGNI
jgi:2-oxoglutarate dehydrogenase E2 component (dihydrolipoamide succinyltransferase)